MKDKEKWRRSHEVDVLFHLCLLDLGLPHLYLGDDEPQAREINYKRQQVGVWIQKAYELGTKHEHDRNAENSLEEFKRKYGDDKFFVPKKKKKRVITSLRPASIG